MLLRTERKATGAYYTDADVTGYLARSALIPYLLDTVATACPDAFLPAWGLLRTDPVRYLSDLDRPLPTETPREHAARRARGDTLRHRLRADDIHSVNDLVTHNLDLARFSADVIARADPLLLRAIWQALREVTVLDPTCGTGAFLHAALDVLAPLYHACLDRMRGVRDRFRAVLAEADAVGPGWFVVRSILLRNLHGVDRAGAAIKGCAQRLRQELLARVPASELPEPLPELGDNLRVGNALVGCVTEGEARRWRTAQPFHWHREFPDVLARGGFDVVLGNPPYVEYARVRSQYEVHGYETLSCGNLWALVLERCLALTHDGSRLGLIVPLSLMASRKMRPALGLLERGGFTSLLPLSGDAHPGVLFDGVKMSYTVLTHRRGERERRQVVVDKLHRWLAEERPTLFQRVAYHAAPSARPAGYLVKCGGGAARSIFEKILGKTVRVRDQVVAHSPHRLLYHRIVRHFVKCLRSTPYFRNTRDGAKRSEDYKELCFASAEAADVVRAVLSSSAFYCSWFLGLSDSYHLGRDLILDFPFDFDRISRGTRTALIELGGAYERDLYRHARRRRIRYRTTGWIEYDEFYPRRSRPIADRIDAALAPHYGFTDEEVDFLVHYDEKYRMGRAEDEDVVELRVPKRETGGRGSS
jgi:hypothetical protein